MTLPSRESLVRDLADGNFVAQQRNVVLVGGTGTGKTQLAIAIARSCIRSGSRGRFFNTVDLVNRLEAESRAGARAGLLTSSPVSTSLSSTSSAICRSRKRADNCCFTPLAASTNVLR